MTTKPTSQNLALFAQFSESKFLRRSLQLLKSVSRKHFVFSDNAQVLQAAAEIGAHKLVSVELKPTDGDTDELQTTLEALLTTQSSPVVILVDIAWAVDNPQSGILNEQWNAVAERLTDAFACTLVSIYNLDYLIENQMQAALRSHPMLLAPSGVCDNPYWLPSALSSRGTVDEQMAFLLGRVVSDYAGMAFIDQSNQSNARGTSPDWLAASKTLQPTQSNQQRWHIRCLGPLKIYTNDSHCVNWQIAGGSPNKTRTLFAFLLQAGEKGVHADRIGELLWPKQGTEKVKRSRLHYAVTMLRKTLGERNTIVRHGEYYRLNAPEGSWTDISSFEQMCRRGLALGKQGQSEDAIRVYRSAEKLYSGDLFEDIPVEYVHSELEDWCLPQRRWLREMAIKLHRDLSVQLRGIGEADDALKTCQKALLLDPGSEAAHMEAMRVYHAQGRIDAVSRQYRQYLSTADDQPGTQASAPIHSVHESLVC